MTQITLPARSTTSQLVRLRTHPRAHELRVLEALARHQFLTIPQVQYAFFSPGSYTHVCALMAQLVADGWVDKRPLDRRSPYGNAPSIFTLSTRARKYLDRQGMAVRLRYRPSEGRGYSTEHLLHLASVNDVLLRAQRLGDEVPAATLNDFLHDDELRQNPVPVTLPGGKRVRVCPDGWLSFHLRRDGRLRQRCVVLELDRGSHHQPRFRQKVRALLSYAAGPYQAAFQTSSLTIAFVAVRGDEHRRRLLSWIHRELVAQQAEQMAEFFLVRGGDPATMSPRELFCTPRWFQPFQSDPVSLLELGGGVPT